MTESFMKNPVAKLGALVAGAAIALSLSAVGTVQAYAAELEGWLYTPSSKITSTGGSDYTDLYAHVYDNADWDKANEADDPTTQDASHFTVTTSNPAVAKVDVVMANSVRGSGLPEDDRTGMLQISPVAPGKTTITITYTYGNDTLKESVEVEIVTGAWENTAAGWKYKYSDGEYAKAEPNEDFTPEWVTINGDRYAFDAAGIMRTGWLNIPDYDDEPTWYYLGTDGAAKEGWHKIGGTWYWFNYGSGRMIANNTKKMADGYTYGFTTSGAMAKGWFNNNLVWNEDEKAYTNYRTYDGQRSYIQPSWYYFNNNGAAKVGWNKIKGKWYYLGNWNNPRMCIGYFTDGAGDNYATDRNGAMVKGWTNLNWEWNSATGAYTNAFDRNSYVYNPATDSYDYKMAVNYNEPEWYYATGNGKLAYGWNKIKGKWYYLGVFNNEQLVVNTVFADQAGDWYVADHNGVMRTGWHDLNVRWDELTGKYTNLDPKGEEIDSKWYYGTSNGQLAYGWNKIKNKWYYLGEYGYNCSMSTGWTYVEGDWYFLDNESGAMAANTWVNDYYLTKSGAMAKNTWIGKYHVNADGVWDQTA